MHNMTGFLGAAVGVAIAVVIWVVVVSLRKERSGDAPQFDERQLAARARAYSSAFFTLLGYLAVVAVLDSVAEVHWCDLYTACFLGMMLALDVFAVAAIRSDAYFGIHERPVASIVLFAFVAVLNLGVAIARFAAGEPLETDRLAEALAISHAEAAEQCVLLQQRLAESDLPLELRRLENSWQLCTIAGYDTVIRTALELRSNTPLSNAAMEVLAVVAYNQPVTRSFIEQVRGVDSSSVVASLEEKGLIEEAGRMELPGRPVAFRTTAAFLRCFGLSDLSELPELQPPEEAEETEEEEQLGFDDLTPEEEK